MNCRWVASDHPRMLTDRHLEDCPGETCPGCWPCPLRHCATCGRTHVDHNTCPGCVADARTILDNIGRMVAALPGEAEARGIDSEAMNLLGPSVDPEMRGHAEASYLAGRLPEGWLDATHGKDCPTLRNEPCTGCGGSELHPLLVLGTDMLEWQAEMDHDDDSKITVERALGYLHRNLAHMAQWPHIDFRATVRRWSQCARHMEAVLHDGEQIETGAPCMTCDKPLQRVYAGDKLPWTYRDGSSPRAGEDVWACGRCREWRTESDYRLNVAELHRGQAEWLTDRDMEIRTGVKAGTVREWARRGHVKKRLDGGRVTYRVLDVDQRRGSRSAHGGDVVVL